MDFLAGSLAGTFLIVIGLIMSLYLPGHMNSIFGYKTPLAMKSKDIWNEANHFFGIMLLVCGIVFILFSILMGYLYSNHPTVLTIFLATILLLSFLYTEIHLRKLFDKNGVRK